MWGHIKVGSADACAWGTPPYPLVTRWLFNIQKLNFRNLKSPQYSIVEIFYLCVGGVVQGIYGSKYYS
jgi:hypothetical protein